MNYDHSRTKLRMEEVTNTEYVSPLKQFFRQSNPLEQQAALERENMRHRPSRATRYLNQRVYAVGEREFSANRAKEKSVVEGFKITASSFVSGLIFAGFLSTPVGSLVHSLKGANMRSKTLFPDMIAAGLKTGARNGLAYGMLLATFRGANYALSGVHDDNQQTVTTITASGALGSAVGSIVYAGGLQRPLFVAGATGVGAVLFFAASQYVLQNELVEGYDVPATEI